jgi:signal transduction histidine kinase
VAILAALPYISAILHPLPTAATVTPSPDSAKRASLLIVDDQAVNIQTLYHIFHTMHEVFMATNGPQALEFCQTQKPDLILLDVMMPDMDGHEVCRRLKADPATADIPIIFVTANSDPTEEAKSLFMGAADFIPKPVNIAVVKARVQTQLMLRKAMTEINALNQSLEKRVEERTQELAAEREKLHESQQQLASSEAKATLSTLVASVSHELGTPIGNSLMSATYLSDRSRDIKRNIEKGQMKRSDLFQFIEEAIDGSDLMERNLLRAKDLIKSFNQVAADQASEQRREFDLGRAVSEILDTLAPSIRKKSHRVVTEIPEGIFMDSLPGPLGQVVINLVNNAYLHAFDGRENGVFTISGVSDSGRVMLKFVDNGVGMSAENLERICQPFFSTKIGRGGTGLGMSIVSNLVEKTLGGTLKISSELGVGTTFEINLPRVLPEDKPA